jgi:hypothetical protein
LNDLLLENSGKTFNKQNELLTSVFENWRGNLEQADDVCVIGIKL